MTTALQADVDSFPAVDPVAVTVKVPYHLELATAALDAGKAVYCEWPLGNGLHEAETLAALAKKRGVLAVAGLQARSAPSVAYLRELIEQGYVGEVLSTTLIGSGMGWGPTVEPFNAYLNDKKNGATMLSIAVGHAADALCYCLGEVSELSATITVRRKTFTIAETDVTKPMTADDQVCVSGLLEGGAAFSIHYRGGASRGTNLLWEINGTEGDLQLTATGGQPQIWEMDVRGGKGGQSSLEILPVPERYRWSPPQGPGPTTNMAQAYARFARDYREGTHLCPTRSVDPRGRGRPMDSRALRVTVGGTGKLVDRIERAGLIAREPDRDDRRASRVVLTTAGKRKLTAALKTYEAVVGSILGGVLRPVEQRQLSDYVSRLLTSIDQAEE